MPRPPQPEISILAGRQALALATEIRNHPDNARKGDIAAIADSIREHGFYGRLYVQASTGYILKGNHSYLAGVSLGMVRFPVEYLDVDDEEALAILAHDNVVSDKAGYHDEKLAALLSKIALKRGERGDKGLRGTGYTEGHLESLKEKIANARHRRDEAGEKKRASAAGQQRFAVILLCDDEQQQLSVSSALENEGYNPVRTLLDARTKLAIK